MATGFYDITSHTLEQYFSGEDDNISDYIMGRMLKSMIHSSRIAVKNPLNYEVRSNIMWTATWALSTLVSKGKTTDCIVHMIGQPAGAHMDATHGMTLSAVSMAYYRFLMPYGLVKFERYAVDVWDVDPVGKTDEELVAEGLEQIDSYMKELGLVTSIRGLGVTEEMTGGIANGTFVMGGGYKILIHNETVQILKGSTA